MHSEPMVKKRLKRAEKEFNKMWKEIKPYVKERKRKTYSTTGSWKTSNCDLLDQKNK